MTTQLTRDDLDAMNPQQIEAARVAGRLATILGSPPADAAMLDRATGTLTPQDVRDLAALGRHDLIEQARTDNRITYTESEI